MIMPEEHNASGRLLEKTADRFRRERAAELDEQDPLAHILERGLRFGLETHGAVSVLLGARLVLHAAIVARTYWELSLTYLWASRANGGWERLQSEWAGQDRDWAERARARPDLARIAEQVLKDEVRDARVQAAKRLPDVLQRCQQIDQADRAAGIDFDTQRWHEFQYLVVYRVLSRAVHPHASILDVPSTSEIQQRLTATVVGATFDLCRAVYYAYDWPIDPIVDAVTRIAGSSRADTRPSGEDTDTRGIAKS